MHDPLGGANLSCLAGDSEASKTARRRDDWDWVSPPRLLDVGVVLLRRVRLIVLATALLAPLGLARPTQAQGRPSCPEVLRQLTHTHGTADAGKVAEKMGTDADWVEKCALTYGRRIKPKAQKIDEEDSEDLTAAKESQEFQEKAREERDQQANMFQGDLDNYKARDRVRGIDPDSSAEWEPYITHEWEPDTGHEWEPFILDDDHPNEE